MACKCELYTLPKESNTSGERDSKNWIVVGATKCKFLHVARLFGCSFFSTPKRNYCGCVFWSYIRNFPRVVLLTRDISVLPHVLPLLSKVVLLFSSALDPDPYHPTQRPRFAQQFQSPVIKVVGMLRRTRSNARTLALSVSLHS